jgi:anti-sigma factor RsiW
MRMTCQDVEALVEVYVDGELDLERSLALEAHTETCRACRARVESARALAATVQSAPYFDAPAALVSRLSGSSSSDAAARVTRPTLPRWMWSLPAIAAGLVLVLGLSSVWMWRTQAAANATARAVVASHVRSLMADHVTDVASSDHHTVKPWFAGRLDFTPPVVDLASEGFPLVGGRLDYIDDRAAAALVYRHQSHTINVFIWPATQGTATHVVRTDPRGFHLVSWTQAGLAMWVVSDMDLTELQTFADALDRRIASGS